LTSYILRKAIVDWEFACPYYPALMGRMGGVRSSEFGMSIQPLWQTLGISSFG